MVFRSRGSRLILAAFLLQFLVWVALVAIPVGKGAVIGGGAFMLCAAQWVLFPLVLASLVGGAAVVFEIFGKRRWWVFIECAVVVVLGLGLFKLEIRSMWPIERRAYAGMAMRAEPLISAIGAYQTKYGDPPPTLSALVPEFLPTVPGTGMRGFPEFRYLRAMDGRHNPLGEVEADWELYVFCGCFVGFDQLFYWPGGKYPTGHTRGGYIERIGDWAYVHE